MLTFETSYTTWMIVLFFFSSIKCLFQFDFPIPVNHNLHCLFAALALSECLRDHTQALGGSGGKNIKKGLNTPFKARGISLLN